MSEILELVRRRLVFIVLCAVVAAAVPAALATASPDSYRATARLFVGTSAQDVTAANQGNLAAQSRVRTYGLMAVGPELLARAARQSGVSITGSELAKRISVSTPPDTVLLDIAATAATAQEAAALSDAVAQQLVSLVSQAERPLRGGSPSLGLLILQPADAGTSKVPLLQPTVLAAYGVGGLVLGAVIAILIPGRFRLVKRRGRGANASTPQSSGEVAAAGHDGTASGSPREPAVATPPSVADGRGDRSSLDVPHRVNGTPADVTPLPTTPTPANTPASTNGHSSSPSTNGWDAVTDPRGWVSPFASSPVEPATPRRHRRESGGWQFRDRAESFAVNGDRGTRRRDETTPS